MSLNEVKKTRGKQSKRPTEQELAEIYSRMTAREVAEHYGVSVSTVKTWIAYYRKLEVKNGN